MDFLNEIGIENSIIEEIIKYNGEAILLDLDSYYENVKSNYLILKEMGITCINELLIYKLDIFFVDTETLKNSLRKINNLENFVLKVNNDFYNIDELL